MMKGPNGWISLRVGMWVAIEQGGSNILAEVPATAEHLSAKRVSDVLVRVPVTSIGPDAAPQEAANVMAQSTIEAVPVVDRDGRLVGIVTESDLVRWLGD